MQRGLFCHVAFKQSLPTFLLFCFANPSAFFRMWSGRFVRRTWPLSAGLCLGRIQPMSSFAFPKGFASPVLKNTTLKARIAFSATRGLCWQNSSYATFALWPRELEDGGWFLGCASHPPQCKVRGLKAAEPIAVFSWFFSTSPPPAKQQMPPVTFWGKNSQVHHLKSQSGPTQMAWVDANPQLLMCTCSFALPEEPVSNFPSWHHLKEVICPQPWFQQLSAGLQIIWLCTGEDRRASTPSPSQTLKEIKAQPQLALKPGHSKYSRIKAGHGWKGRESIFEGFKICSVCSTL